MCDLCVMLGVWVSACACVYFGCLFWRMVYCCIVSVCVVFVLVLCGCRCGVDFLLGVCESLETIVGLCACIHDVVLSLVLVGALLFSCVCVCACTYYVIHLFSLLLCLRQAVWVLGGFHFSFSVFCVCVLVCCSLLLFCVLFVRVGWCL